MSAKQYVYTGVAATVAEESTMRSPRLIMGFGAFAPAPSYQARIHACALTHGLPEIPGFYGYDFERHEFIRMPFEQGTPEP